MIFSDFEQWKQEFNEALLVEYAIDLEDIGLTDEQLMKLADEPACMAVSRFAEKHGLQSKSGGFY